jgi:hypothetical protein
MFRRRTYVFVKLAVLITPLGKEKGKNCLPEGVGMLIKGNMLKTASTQFTLQSASLLLQIGNRHRQQIPQESTLSFFCFAKWALFIKYFKIVS